MDLASCIWKAEHTDKTVIYPNYSDINRKTIQSIEIDNLIKIERPEETTKWLISWRLRTQVSNGLVARRFWIFNDRTRGLLIRLHEDGKVDVVETYEELGIGKGTITGIDEL